MTDYKNQKVILFIDNHTTTPSTEIFKKNNVGYSYEGTDVQRGSSYYDKVYVEKYVISRNHLDLIEKAFEDLGITIYYRTVGQKTVWN